MPPVPRQKKRPKTHRIDRVTDYADLQGWAYGFIEGRVPLMILIGGHGLGKSQMFRDALKAKKGCWIEGSVTAFGMYQRLCQAKDKLVVIDDVDALCYDRAAINLLKSLCQTDEVKTLCWQSSDKFLESNRLPPSFETKSKVVVITNNWKTLNRNVSAVEDRGVLIEFVPSVEEVHQQAASWFKDQEIYEWFGMNLHRIETPSFRHYIRASVYKANGKEWKAVLGDVPKDKRTALVESLMKDKSFTSNEQRARAFEKKGGGCRATFFNYQRKLKVEV